MRLEIIMSENLWEDWFEQLPIVDFPERKQEVSKEKENMNMQTEQQIFDELSVLCGQKGFIHVLVQIWFEDNYLKPNRNGNITESQVLKLQVNRNKLNRNELNTLLALLIKNNPNFAQDNKLNSEILGKYKEESYQLLEKFHNVLTSSSMRGMMDEIIPLYHNSQPPSHNSQPPSFAEFTESKAFLKPDTIREAIFYSGDGVYDFQYQYLGGVKYKNDEEWFSKNKEFSIDWVPFFLEIIFAIHHNKINEPELISIDAFTYSKNEIIEFIFQSLGEKAAIFFPIDLMLYFIESFCINLNCLDKLNEFQKFDDFNPIVAFPFIKLEQDKFLLLDIYTLSQAFYETPFFWLNDDKEYRNIASDNRGKFTENFTYEICCDIFGKENVWCNVDLYSKSNLKDKAGEADILVNICGTALIFQAKSKKLTLESRKGNIPIITKDFSLAIQAAYNQAFECSEILLENNYIAKIDDETIRLPEINYCVPICVLSEHFPALTVQIRWLLEEKQNTKIAPALVIDVFLLHLMHLTLKTPLEFLHFIHSLSKSRKKFLAQTQIDLLSVHLSRNFLCSEDADMFMLDNGSSAELDLFILNTRRRRRNEEIQIPSCWLKFKDTYWWQLFIFNSSLDTVDKLKFGLELLQCPGEFIENYNSIVLYIVTQLKLNPQKLFSDFTIYLSNNHGMTVYVCSSPVIANTNNLINKLYNHIQLRKYHAKSDLWFGLIISVTGIVKHIEFLDFKWEFNSKLQQKYQNTLGRNSRPISFIKGKAVTQKIGRNAPCPCGSGQKYKRCCLNRN